MSGPKAYSYSVPAPPPDPRVEARRRVARAEAQLERSRREERLLQRQYPKAALPKLIVPAPLSLEAGADELDRRATELQALADARHAALRVVRDEQIAGAVSAVLRMTASGPALSATAVVSDAPDTDEDASLPLGAGELRGEVARILGRVPADVTDHAGRLERGTTAVLSAESRSGQLRALSTLRVLAARVGEEHLACEGRLQRLTAVLARTRGTMAQGEAGAEHDAAARLCDDVLAAIAGEESDAEHVVVLERRAEDLAAAQEAQRRRLVAAATLGDSLRQLGYAVGESFDTALVHGGRIDVRHRDWDGYAVRVRAPAAAENFAFNVVRGAATRADQRARDIEVERAFCGTLPALQRGMAEAGVRLSLLHAVPAGERPVEEDTSLSVAAPAKRARPQNANRSRTR